MLGPEVPRDSLGILAFIVPSLGEANRERQGLLATVTSGEPVLMSFAWPFASYTRM